MTTAASILPRLQTRQRAVSGNRLAGGYRSGYAVLTDDRSVHHGRAGDTVEGRYRIVSTGEASVELEDLTTGARMTLRLSGS